MRSPRDGAVGAGVSSIRILESKTTSTFSFLPFFFSSTSSPTLPTRAPVPRYPHTRTSPYHGWVYLCAPARSLSPYVSFCVFCITRYFCPLGTFSAALGHSRPSIQSSSGSPQSEPRRLILSSLLPRSSPLLSSSSLPLIIYFS